MRRYLFHILLSATLSCVTGCSSGPNPEIRSGEIQLSSDFQPLVDGFEWAKTLALSYVSESDPVGKWYEAALPGREAFCMRDVSHQAYGAMALGLGAHTKNMMSRFAESISESRDWCSYWEINRYDAPAPVDYRSDDDFWYNLPANFDILRSIQQIFEWGGDTDYLHDPVFENFYVRSLNDYVQRWDTNGDGLVDSRAENGIRGIPTYWEGGGPRAFTGGDLVAAHFAATLAYSEILSARGDTHSATVYKNKSGGIRQLYNDTWWNAAVGRFSTSLLEDNSFDTTHVALMQIMPFFFGIVQYDSVRALLLDNLKEGGNVEDRSYQAEAYYRYGRNERAFRSLMAQLDPQLPRREYPENPFTAVGSITHFLIGINPLASQGVIETKSRLPEAVSWVEIEHVPVLNNSIMVRHVGVETSHLLNETGDQFVWRAVFEGEHDALVVNGEQRAAEQRLTFFGTVETFVDVIAKPGEPHVVSIY